MLADSSARIERVQDSYTALQEAKLRFANDFRHLLKTYTDMMENMEVASAREIETSLCECLDTDEVAVVPEAAQQEAPSADEPILTAGMVAEPPDAQDTLSGLEPAEEYSEVQEIGSAADEQPTPVIRTEGSEPLAVEPESKVPVSEDPEVAEPEVEPSTAQDERDHSEALQEAPDTETASEVEREEPPLAEESRSEQSFDREDERSDSRIFRASRFLRRRE
jgi:cell division initiation protein